MRPTMGRVLGALFSMLGPDGARGLCVADLYAGTGSFGIEALRRGAHSVLFVERNDRLCRRISEQLLKVDCSGSADVRRGDVFSVLGRLGSRAGKFDLVFADPPYAVNPFERLLGRLSGLGLLKEDAVVYLEHSTATETPSELPGVKLVTRRKYGDSAVSVYRKSDAPTAPQEGAGR